MATGSMLKLSQEDLLFRLDPSLFSIEPVKILVQNIHNCNVGFKVKTNVSKQYKFKPTHGILLPNEEREIQISAQLLNMSEAVDCKHKFLIYACEVPEDLPLNNFSAYTQNLSKNDPSVRVENLKMKVSCIVENHLSQVSNLQQSTDAPDLKEKIIEKDNSNVLLNSNISEQKNQKNMNTLENKNENKETVIGEKNKNNQAPFHFDQTTELIKSIDSIDEETKKSNSKYANLDDAKTIEQNQVYNNTSIQRFEDKDPNSTNTLISQKPSKETKIFQKEQNSSVYGSYQSQIIKTSSEDPKSFERIPVKVENKIQFENSPIKKQEIKEEENKEPVLKGKDSSLAGPSISISLKENQLKENQNKHELKETKDESLQISDNQNKLELNLMTNKYNKLFEEYSKLLKENQFLQSEKNKLTGALQLKSLKESSTPKQETKKPLPLTPTFSKYIIYCLVALIAGIIIGYILNK